MKKMGFSLIFILITIIYFLNNIVGVENKLIAVKSI